MGSSSSPFSLVQLANINMLSALQDVGRRDPQAACLVFHLSKQELSSLMDLSPGQIFDLVEGVGQMCLFAPRTDFMSMISQVPQVTRMLAASKINHPHEVRKSWSR